MALDVKTAPRYADSYSNGTFEVIINRPLSTRSELRNEPKLRRPPRLPYRPALLLGTPMAPRTVASAVNRR